MQLMIAQLRNQDPTKPMDPSAVPGPAGAVRHGLRHPEHAGLAVDAVGLAALLAGAGRHHRWSGTTCWPMPVTAPSATTGEIAGTVDHSGRRDRGQPRHHRFQRPAGAPHAAFQPAGRGAVPRGMAPPTWARARRPATTRFPPSPRWVAPTNSSTTQLVGTCRQRDDRSRQPQPHPEYRSWTHCRSAACGE